jgi:hypothetical protein
MPVGLYMDVHIPRAIANGLRRLDVDVLTAQGDGTTTLAAPALLDRATQLGRALYSQDDDLLTEARRRIVEDEPFAGVIYSHQLNSPIGRCIQDLEIIAKASDPEDLASQIIFIPF